MEITSYMLPFDIYQQAIPENRPEETPEKQIPTKQPERHIPDIPHKNPDPTKPSPDVDDPERKEPTPIKEPGKIIPERLIWLLEYQF